MTAASDGLAQRLLDAQVEWLLGEVTGERLAANIVRDVDDVLAVAGTLVLGEIVDVEQVKATGRRLVERVGGSPVVGDLVAALSEAIYDLGASEDYRLGDVVDREPVEALIVKVLSMHTLHDRVLDRLTESPLVATIASRFVTKIVGDFLHQNRERAERLPGMSSLLSLSTNAASRVRGATDRHLDQFLGDAAGRTTQFAVRRTNSAAREMLREAPLHGAAMELWDLHADEPISDLRQYLSREDLREVALLVHQIVLQARNTEFAGELLDACIDVFFDRYGKRDVASLLDELGVQRDELVEEVSRYAPPIIEAVKRAGVLARLIRARLEPFFTSPEVAALLAAPA